MSETVRCGKCGEEFYKQSEKGALTFCGYCWNCNNFTMGKETTSDCMERTLRDFRKSDWEAYIKWISTDGSPAGLPDPHKRQLNALISAKESRAIQEKEKNN